MQLDIRLLKNIINSIKDKESYYVSTAEILEDVKEHYNHLEREDFINHFCGHLLLLKDNRVIEEVSGCNLGISYDVKGIQFVQCNIRLTSKGHDYIKVLNKDGIIDKLKKLTLTESLKVSEHILLKSIEHFIIS